MIKDLSKWGIVKEEQSFKQLTTLKVGGSIKYYFEPYNMYAFTQAFDYIQEQEIPYKIVGNGSNLLCSDEFYDGVVIKLNNLNHYEINGNEMYIEAGVAIIVAANFAINNGLSGLEFATGIPATLGGIVYMNASAYNEAISDVIDSVLVYRNKSLDWILIEDLEFSYRTSSFQEHKDWIILAVNLHMKEDSVSRLKDLSIDRNRRRFDTQPYTKPNCGSIFRNPPEMQVWKVIDDLGLRGKQYGMAMISEKHSNFICNLGDCRAQDVNVLIEEISHKSKTEMGIDLHLEVERFNW